MRKWEVTLRRDSTTWADFKLWLGEQEAIAKEALMSADNFERARGKVDGIRAVIHAATLTEREEKSNARRQS